MLIIVKLQKLCLLFFFKFVKDTSTTIQQTCKRQKCFPFLNLETCTIHCLTTVRTQTVLTSTRTPSWVTEVVSYAQVLSTLERGFSHFPGNPGPMNVTFVCIFIGVNVLLRKVMRFLRKKSGVKHHYYTSGRPQSRCLD